MRVELNPVLEQFVAVVAEHTAEDVDGAVLGQLGRADVVGGERLAEVLREVRGGVQLGVGGVSAHGARVHAGAVLVDVILAHVDALDGFSALMALVRRFVFFVLVNDLMCVQFLFR